MRGPPIRRRSNLIAIVCLVAAIICWGLPPVMLRYLTCCVTDGYTTNLVRYPLATIVYLPFMAWYLRGPSPRRSGFGRAGGRGLGRFWVAALLPSVVNVAGQTFFALAPYELPAGVMSFLVRISVIWSVVLAFWLFPDERPLARSLQFWAGAGLAAIGFLLMWLGNPAEPLTIAGVVIIFLCSVFWGLYDVTVRYTMRDLHPLIVFGVIGNYTSVGLIALAPLGEPRSVLSLSANQFLLLLASAYIGIAIAHGLYYVAIQRLGVAVSAVTMLLTPFVSILCASIFLGERFSAGQWTGGTVLIAGAALALWSRQQIRRGQPPAPEISPD